MIITALTSAFSALRVYALWQGSMAKHVFPAIVFLLGVFPVGTNIFSWIRTTTAYEDLPPLPTCTSFTNISPKLDTDVIAADVIVLALTWAKSLKQFQEMRKLNLGSSISAVLLRDGTFYFVAILAVNILQLLTYSAKGLTIGAYTIDFLQSMPPLLVQRFILNLRQLNLGAMTESNSDARHFSRFSVNFRMPSDLLGNIGEPLDHGQWEHIQEDSLSGVEPRNRVE
ncbi:uncharacterized protein PHACADRAFT_207547 [Phanerochaete carnosa HHB-10118-sp]|uniref:Uncharacterized protein n=1 Tax=Phanerochaete carnosa (strain HHB-10118-sp) TaxID=650164 RepID=K5V1A0_PHACS|nr:uncharacterized protein PHACADRAFT_207547 [Phanerochaete carnosa HHB-10118-sp]EKM56266.1 hypothetical protein PHACADRAFT_207547 [Phanerochaete carnosa HHB-10118-sp]